MSFLEVRSKFNITFPLLRPVNIFQVKNYQDLNYKSIPDFYYNLDKQLSPYDVIFALVNQKNLTQTKDIDSFIFLLNLFLNSISLIDKEEREQQVGGRVTVIFLYFALELYFPPPPFKLKKNEKSIEQKNKQIFFKLKSKIFNLLILFDWDFREVPEEVFENVVPNFIREEVRVRVQKDFSNYKQL